MSKQSSFLQTLLAQSGQRQPVEYDPSEEQLNPAVGAGGQFDVTVQEVPENNLERLSRSLRQLPTVAGQAVNVVQNEAAERVATMSDAEIEKELGADKKTLNILGYDKAFQREMVKNWFIKNEASIAKRFEDLASDPSQFHSDAHFNQVLEQEKQTFFGELEQQFGQNPRRVEAYQVIGNEMLRKLTPSVSGQYVQNKLDATKDFMATSFADQINNGQDTNIALRGLHGQLKALNIEPKQVSALLLDNVVASATQHMNRGSLVRALDIVDKGRDFEVFKGAKLGSGKNLTRLANLRRQILDAVDSGTATSNATARRRGTEMFTSEAIKMLTRSPEDFNALQTDPTTRQPLVDLVQHFVPGASDEELNSIVDAVSKTQANSRALELHKQIQRLIYSKGADANKWLWAEVGGTLMEKASDLQREPVTNYRNLNADEISILTKKAVNYSEANKNKDAADFMAENGFRGADPPEGVQQIFDKRDELNFLSNVRFTHLDSDVETQTDPTTFEKLAKEKFAELEPGDAPEGRLSDDALEKQLPTENELASMYEDFVKTMNEYARVFKDHPAAERKKELEEFALQLRNDLVDEKVLLRQAVLNSEELRGPVIPGKPGDIVEGDYGFLKGWLGMGDDSGDIGSLQEARNLEQALDFLWFDKKVSKEDRGDYTLLGKDQRMKLNEKLSADEQASLFAALSEQMEDARKDDKSEVISYLALAYGYPTYMVEAARDLRDAGIATANVRLFKDRKQLNDITNLWRGAIEAFEADGLNAPAESTEDLKEAFEFGIHNKAALESFKNAQINQLNRHPLTK